MKPAGWRNPLLYRYILIEIALGHAEADLIGFAEIRSRIVCCAVEVVFVLNAHRTLIARALKNPKELGPGDTSHTGNAELPPLCLVYGHDPATANNVPMNLGVFQVNVIDLVDEVLRRLNGVHHLPQQMRGVVLQTDVGGILEGIE